MTETETYTRQSHCPSCLSFERIIFSATNNDGTEYRRDYCAECGE